MEVLRKEIMRGVPNTWQHDVLNPAVVLENGIEHMLYRAVKKPNTSNIGYARLEDGNVMQRSISPLIRCGQTERNSVGVEDPRITKIDGKCHVWCTAYDGGTYVVEDYNGESLFNLKSSGIVSPCISLQEAVKSTNSDYYKKMLSSLGVFHDMQKPVPDKDAVLFPEKMEL